MSRAAQSSECDVPPSHGGACRPSSSLGARPGVLEATYRPHPRQLPREVKGSNACPSPASDSQTHTLTVPEQFHVE